MTEKDPLFTDWIEYVESYNDTSLKKVNLISANHVVNKLLKKARAQGYTQALDNNDILHGKEGEEFLNDMKKKEYVQEFLNDMKKNEFVQEEKK